MELERYKRKVGVACRARQNSSCRLTPLSSKGKTAGSTSPFLQRARHRTAAIIGAIPNTSRRSSRCALPVLAWQTRNRTNWTVCTPTSQVSTFDALATCIHGSSHPRNVPFTSLGTNRPRSSLPLHFHSKNWCLQPSFSPVSPFKTRGIVFIIDRDHVLDLILDAPLFSLKSNCFPAARCARLFFVTRRMLTCTLTISLRMASDANVKDEDVMIERSNAHLLRWSIYPFSIHYFATTLERSAHGSQTDLLGKQWEHLAWNPHLHNIACALSFFARFVSSSEDTEFRPYGKTIRLTV